MKNITNYKSLLMVLLAEFNSTVNSVEGLLGDLLCGFKRIYVDKTTFHHHKNLICR